MGGDFNEELGLEVQGLTKVFQDCNLVDVMIAKNGIPSEPFSSSLRSTKPKVIDYTYISPSLLPAVDACGYEPFMSGIVSDHRSMYIDFNDSLLYGSATVEIPPMAGRDLSSKSPQQVTDYFAHKQLFLDQHNFKKQLEIFEAKPTKARLQKLDRTLAQASIYAGKRVKRYPSAPYSPALALLRNKFNLLRILFHQFTYNRDHTEAIQSILQRITDEDWKLPQTREECKARYNLAKAELRKAENKERKTGKLRQAHLEARAAVMAQKGDKAMAKIVNQLRRAEEMKQVYAKCAHARGKLVDSGLSHLEVPDPSDQEQDPKKCKKWIRITCPQDIQDRLAKRNQKHFSQMQGTPLTQPPFQHSPPLSYDIDFQANSLTAELILEGDYPTEALDDITALMVAHMKRVTAPDQLDCTLTEEAFDGKLKAWKESTSTSPSGIHLGHLKAYYAPHSHKPGTKEAKELETNRTNMKLAHLKILNYALQQGVSLNRWKVITNTMIEKDPGSPKIHRLRVIHIYEADYNLILAHHWRKLLQHASDNNLLNPSQYGSQPGKEAYTPVLIDIAQYEICKTSGNPMIKFDNDATSCYDRIHCFLANVVSQKYGINKAVCMVQGTTLEEAKYHLKTKLGVSDTFVKHCWFQPWYGTGQGSGNSPVYWLVISSTLFDAYESKAHGALFESPDRTESIQVFMAGFVDDTSNTTNDFAALQVPSPADLIKLATNDAQLWHDILWSSGGALELPKCSYHHIRYTYNHMAKQSLVEGKIQPQMVLTDPQGRPFPIKILDNKESHKILGSHQCPHTNQSKQTQVLTKNCNSFARALCNSHLTRREAWIMYHGIYIPSAGYPLPLCYYKEDDLAKIQGPAHRAFMTACGYAKSTKYAICFGPDYYGGAGFWHLYDIEGIGQIQQFMKHWRTPGQAHSHMRIAVSWLQYFLGTSKSFLTDTTTKLPHLQSDWYGALRRYLAACGSYFELDNDFVPPLQREHDAYLMEIAMASGKFTKAELVILNQCRIYLQVVTVSDICNAAGTKILPSFLKGKLHSNQSKANWHPFRHPRPSSRCWEKWTRLMRLIYPHSNTRALRQRLGKWLHHPSSLRRTWPAYVSHQNQRLYCPTPQGFTTHVKSGHSYLSQQQTGPTLQATDLPPDAVPIDMKLNPPFILTVQNYQPQVPIQPPPPPTSFLQYIQSLPAWEQHLLQHVTFLQEETIVCQHMQAGTIVLVSDGSEMNKQGSHGWVLASTTTKQDLVQNQGPAPTSKASPFRAEAYGKLSGLRFIVNFSSYHAITIPTNFDMGLDCQGVIKRIYQYKSYKTYYPNETLNSDWDVCQEIVTSLQQLPQAQTCKVKGHQDKKKKKDEEPLTHKEELNIKAHQLATSYHSLSQATSTTIVPRLPGNKCQLHTPKGTVTTKVKYILRDQRNEKALCQYITAKNSWDDKVFNTIDWETHGQVHRRFLKHRTTMVKFVHGILPVGTRLQKYDSKNNPACPTCGHPEETQQHFFQCSHTTRLEWRGTFNTAFHETMTKHHTHPGLLALAQEGMNAFMESRPISLQHVPDFPGRQLLIEEQSAIGWENFIRGRVSKRWLKIQIKHLKRIDKYDVKRSPKWTNTLIHTVWTHVLLLWFQRNQDKHGHDETTRREKQEEKTILEIHRLYAMRDLVPEQHQWIFQTPEHEMIMKSTMLLQQWLHQYGPLIELKAAAEN